MPAIKYKVTLADDEIQGLERPMRTGERASRSHARARILLKAAAGFQGQAIIEALDVSPSMVHKTRQRCVEEGPEAALKDRQRPGKAPKLAQEQSAHLIALACSGAPEGHGHWTLRRLAGKAVGLPYYAQSCSYETIRQLLEKHPKALAEAGMVHSGGQPWFCCRHGRCAGPLRRGL
jgi:transposase